MPNTYAHYRFGEEVLNQLPKPIQTTIEQNRALYDIGLHGPDLLFYFNPLSSNHVNQKGSDMHKQNAVDFFQSSIFTLKRQPDPDAGEAYLYGFVCHLALDGECHPYIEKIIQVTGVGHLEIETQLDRHLLLEDGRDPFQYQTAEHIHPTRENAAVIEPFIDGVSEEEIYSSLTSMVSLHEILLATSPEKRERLYEDLKEMGQYDAFQGMIQKEEPNPKCEPFMPLLEEHYHLAIPKAVEMVENYQRALHYQDDLSPLFDETFGAGEHWEELQLE